MKIKILLTNFILLCCLTTAHAQTYKWIKGGGGVESMTPTRNYEQVNHMCTDANGNVYVTAITGAIDIAADTFHVAIAHSIGFSIPHILLASYSCDGTMRWAKLIESYDLATAGGLAYSNGSVYLAGNMVGGDKYVGYDTAIASYNVNSFTLRIDTSGAFKWIRFVGADIPATQTLANDKGNIAIDGQGYIHNFNLIKSGCQVTPTMTIPVTGTYDLKYDTAGNLLNVNQIPSLDSLWLISKVVYNKPNNKFYATLQPNDNYWYDYHSNANYALAAFRADESLIWMDTTGYTGLVLGLDYKGGNDIYVSGWGQAVLGPFTFAGLTATDTIGNLFGTICKLDTNGAGHWIYNLQGSISVNFIRDLTILPNQKIAATGYFGAKIKNGSDSIISTTGEQLNPSFLIIDSAGHTIKMDQLHGVGYDDWGVAITSDVTGNVFIGGSLSSNMSATGLTPYTTHGGNTDFYVVKYGYNCGCTAPAANYTHTGTATVNFAYTGTTGYDSLRWNFGDAGTATTATPTHTYAASGLYHACVTAYTACGADTKCADITVCVGAVTAAFTDTGHHTVGCVYTGITALTDSIVWNFGDGHTGTGTGILHTYTATGTYTICVTVYTACGSDSSCSVVHILVPVAVNNVTTSNVTVYPNPSTGQLVIEHATQGSLIKLLDIVGREVYSGIINNDKEQINMNNLPGGTYLLQLTDPAGNRTATTVVKQ